MQMLAENTMCVCVLLLMIIWLIKQEIRTLEGKFKTRKSKTNKVIDYI